MRTKKQWVNELQLNDRVNSIFLLGAVERKRKRDGGDFFSLQLLDKTGSIFGNLWENFHALAANELKVNDFAQVFGVVTAYQNELRLTIDELKKVPEEQVRLEDFLAASPRSVDAMRKDFFHYLELVSDPFLKQLLERIFKSKEIWQAFSRAPSSTRFHQAYLGGLLEHTNNVVRNALAIAENYPECNRDLLITGALLHDFGKIYEYEFRRSITYTDQGRLLGHLIIGLLSIDRHIQQLPEFPESLRTLLFHLLISHHGTREWGSPRRPKTGEAIILFFADYLDSRLSAFQDALQAAKRTGEKWQWSRSFDHYLFADFGQDREDGEPNQEVPPDH